MLPSLPLTAPRDLKKFGRGGKDWGGWVVCLSISLTHMYFWGRLARHLRTQIFSGALKYNFQHLWYCSPCFSKKRNIFIEAVWHQAVTSLLSGRKLGFLSTVKEWGAARDGGICAGAGRVYQNQQESSSSAVFNLVSLGKGVDACHSPQPTKQAGTQAAAFPALQCGSIWPQSTSLPPTVRFGKLSSALQGGAAPNPRALDHEGSCWECVLINKECLSNHCHVSTPALLSNHRKMAWRRRLQVASGVWWEAECNIHSLHRSHTQFKAPKKHREMLKSKMFAN